MTKTGLKPAQIPQPKKRKADASLPELLYVEDEPVNFEVTERLLRKRYRVAHAATDVAAFDVLRDNPNRFKAILMDIQLKGRRLDGIAITRILRGTYEDSIPDFARDVSLPELPIIFVTAYAARYKKEELIALGGDGLVTKPVELVVLSTTLSKIFSARAKKLLDQYV